MLLCTVTSSAMFVKTQQSPNHLAEETVACPGDFQTYPRCFLFLYSPPCFSSLFIALVSSPQMGLGRGGQGLVKNSWAAFETAVCVGQKGGCKKKKKKKKKSHYAAVKCILSWPVAAYRVTSEQEDSVQLLGTKNTPRLVESSHLNPYFLRVNSKRLSLRVSGVIAHHLLFNTVCCLQNKGQMCRVPN